MHFTVKGNISSGSTGCDKMGEYKQNRGLTKTEVASLSKPASTSTLTVMISQKWKKYFAQTLKFQDNLYPVFP